MKLKYLKQFEIMETKLNNIEILNNNINLEIKNKNKLKQVKLNLILGFI
jgi:hypothetical protein